MDNGESVIRQIDPENDTLESIFSITEEDGFAKNTGYEIGELFSFNNQVCFEHSQYIDSTHQKESFSCYDGEKITTLFEEIRVDNEDYEHIDNEPLISGGKMFFKTNRYRLFIVNQDLTVTIKEDMSVIDSLLLYDGSNLYFKDNSSSSIKKLTSDDNIDDLSSPLFITNSVNNHRTLNELIIFSALNQNQELKYFRLDKNGNISLTSLSQFNIEYNNNTPNYFSHSENDEGKIYKVLENSSITIDSDNSLNDLVVKGDKFWAIIYQFPYRRYIFIIRANNTNNRRC